MISSPHRAKDPGRNAGPIELIADSSAARSDLERQIEDAFDAELSIWRCIASRSESSPRPGRPFISPSSRDFWSGRRSKVQIPVAHVFVAMNRVQKMLREEARILRNEPR